MPTYEDISQNSWKASKDLIIKRAGDGMFILTSLTDTDTILISDNEIETLISALQIILESG